MIMACLQHINHKEQFKQVITACLQHINHKEQFKQVITACLQHVNHKYENENSMVWWNDQHDYDINVTLNQNDKV